MGCGIMPTPNPCYMALTAVAACLQPLSPCLWSMSLLLQAGMCGGLGVGRGMMAAFSAGGFRSVFGGYTAFMIKTVRLRSALAVPGTLMLCPRVDVSAEMHLMYELVDHDKGLRTLRLCPSLRMYAALL